MTPSEITEAHRLAQARLGAEAVRQLNARFPILDPDDIDATFPLWIAAVLPVIQVLRERSARMSAGYLLGHRLAHLGTIDGFQPEVAGPVPASQLTTSLLVTGPVALHSRLDRLDRARALDLTNAGSAASAMRHVLNGGRDTVAATITADRRAAGYRRVTSGSACAFCSMLAGRGAVYKADTVDFPAHDHCSCAAEPVWR